MHSTSRPQPITPFAAWSALAILAGLNLFNYLDRSVISAVLTPMKEELGVNDGDIGWAGSAFMLGYFITAPLFGYLGDRYARKYLMLVGVIIWSLATAASGLAHGFMQLIAIRVVVGVGEACFVTIGPSWISDVFASTLRNTALTLFYVAIPIGSALGYIVGGHFAGQGDWRHAFIYAGLPGVLLALLLLTMREPLRGQADGVAEKIMPTVKIGEIFALLSNRRYNLLVWGYAAQTFAIGAFAYWAPTFLQRAHGMSQGSSGPVFGGMLALAGLVSMLVGGLVASSLRKRTPAGYVWVMAASLVLATPVCFFALMIGNLTLCLVGLGASIFFLFLPMGPIASEIFEIVPVHLRASSMALSTFIIHLFGDFGSPTAVGLVSSHYGDDLQKGVLILPGVLLIGAALWCTLIRFTSEPLEVEV